MNQRDDFEDGVDQPRPGGAKESAYNGHDDSEKSIESQSSDSADQPQGVPADDGAKEASLEFENCRLLDVVAWKTPELRRMLQHVLRSL